MKKIVFILIFSGPLPFLFAEERLADVVSENLTIYLESNLALEKQRGNDIVLDPDVVQFVEETLVEHYSHFWEMIPEDMQNDWVGDWFMESIGNRLTARTLGQGFRHLPLKETDSEELEYRANLLLGQIGDGDEYFREGVEFVLSGKISEEEYRHYKNDMIEFGSYVGNRLHEEVLGREIYMLVPEYMDKDRRKEFQRMIRGAGEDKESQEVVQRWREVYGIPENFKNETFNEDHPILVQKFLASKLVGDHIIALSENFAFSPEADVDFAYKNFLKPYVSMNVRNQITESFSYIVLSLSIFEADHLAQNIVSFDEAKKSVDRVFDGMSEKIYIREFMDVHGAAVNFYSFIFENKRQRQVFQKGNGSYDLIFSPDW